MSASLQGKWLGLLSCGIALRNARLLLNDSPLSRKSRVGSVHQWICVQLFASASASYAPIVRVLGRNSNAPLMSVSKSYSRVVAYTKVLGVAYSGWKRSFADPVQSPRSSDSNVRLAERVLDGVFSMP